jgi:subtilisin-like proprotein convertase family protein
MKKQSSTRAFRVFLSLFALSLAVGVFLKYSGPTSRGQVTKSSPISSAPVQEGPIVGQAANFGVSVAVTKLPEVVDPDAGAARMMVRKYESQSVDDTAKEKNPLNANRVKKSNPVERPDGFAPFVDQALSPAFPSVIPTPSVSFEGLSSMDNTAVLGTTFAPSDSVGDVGPNHYVQMTNTLVRVFNKDGTPAAAPFRLSSLTGVAGGPCANIDDGDPIVNYDPLADRWILSQFCVGPTASPIIPGHQVFAVSKTADPTGQYYVYDFVHPNTKFQDYPHVAVWPDAYYMSSNQFNGNTFSGGGAFAYDRIKMLQGDPTASFVYFDQSSICSDCGGQLPTDLDGTITPPVGMGNLFMEFRATEFGDPVDGLRVFEFKPNFATPSLSSFTQVGTDVVLAAFDGNSPLSRSCVEQPGTSGGLDCVADRMMHRLSYRNLGTVAEPVNSWVLNFTVNVGGGSGSGMATYQAGIRWAELRRPSSTGSLSVNQQGTQSTNPGTPEGGTNLWMGSIAQDAGGNIFLGYSTSGATEPDFPSIKYAGRLSTDPPNTMGQGEAVGHLGTGFQGTAANSRWGDYSAASVDPADECTFWYTQGYRDAEQNASSFGWRTRVIGGIRMPGCTTPPRGSVSGSITACSSGQPLNNAIVTLPGGFVGLTNGNGQYTIINVPVGTTSASATRMGGFDIATSGAVTVNNGESATVNLCLSGIPVLAQAAASLLSESCLPANGVIDPGETVTIGLPVKNTGGADTVNTVGTLQASGGVTSPGASQSYGALLAGGDTITRTFTFTADPDLACGNDITMTVAHQDGAASLGNVVYKLPTGSLGNAAVTSYTGPAVAIPDSVSAGVDIPLQVNGVIGSIADLNFKFDAAADGTCDATIGNTNAAMDHTWIGDLIFRLRSPAGTTVVIMNRRAGSRKNICNTLLDDDGGFPALSTISSSSSSFVSGNFAPDNPLSAFDGENANGTWVLNVSDNAGQDLGSMRRFSLVITPRVCSTNCAVETTPTPTPTVSPSPTVSPTPTPTPTPPASITFAGRVLTPSGNALRNAKVTMTEAGGLTRTVFTTNQGFFTFSNVATGTTVNVTVTSKLYRFSPQNIQIVDGMPEPQFVGLE